MGKKFGSNVSFVFENYSQQSYRSGLTCLNIDRSRRNFSDIDYFNLLKKK